MKHRILFILKRKEHPYDDYGPHGYDQDNDDRSGKGLITGLYNSANFVVQMLNDNGIEAKLVVVTDNNDIDREVTAYKPTDVIIEALWVVPDKFKVLIPLHPTVNWVVRLHSNTPFIANEGIAMKWILDYVAFDKVAVSVNDPRMFKELAGLLIYKYKLNKHSLSKKLLYQPNVYPRDYQDKLINFNKSYLDIGCFGAIRPMKNQLIQALAAIRFCEDHNRILNFHINGDRVEMKGSPILHNLIELFNHFHHKHQLVMHNWTDHETFKQLCGMMDIGMQVSFSETFNIILADHVSMGVPIVASPEIRWTSNWYQADPCDIDSIVRVLNRTWWTPGINVYKNRKGLDNLSERAEDVWVNMYGN